MKKFTVIDGNGNTLKYVFDNRLVFNGENKNARSHFVHKVANFKTAEEIRKFAEWQGIRNPRVVMVNDVSRIKISK